MFFVLSMLFLWSNKSYKKKVRVFLKLRVLFWPEISAYGVFLNFDNERMHMPYS